MRILLILIFNILYAIPIWAFEVGDIIPSSKLESQFGEPMPPSSATHWILFASDKPASKLITEYLTETNTNPETYSVMYVADISKMPSLIFKMMALPKMKKMSFKIALDRDGQVTASWPRHEKKATLIEVKEMKIQKIMFIGSKTELADFFQNIKM